MKHSVGKNLTSGVANTIITVPTGYHAIVTMLFVASTATNGSYSATWVHDGTSFPFQGTKNLNAGSYDSFGGPYGHFLLMKDGDSLVVTPTASGYTALVSFDLEPHLASNIQWP